MDESTSDVDICDPEVGGRLMQIFDLGVAVLLHAGIHDLMIDPRSKCRGRGSRPER